MVWLVCLVRWFVERMIEIEREIACGLCAMCSDSQLMWDLEIGCEFSSHSGDRCVALCFAKFRGWMDEKSECGSGRRNSIGQIANTFSPSLARSLPQSVSVQTFDKAALDWRRGECVWCVEARKQAFKQMCAWCAPDFWCVSFVAMWDMCVCSLRVYIMENERHMVRALRDSNSFQEDFGCVNIQGCSHNMGTTFKALLEALRRSQLLQINIVMDT